MRLRAVSSLHDHPINLDPKPRGGTVGIVLGKEGAKQRLGAGRGAEVRAPFHFRLRALFVAQVGHETACRTAAE